jgi:hypothetical protein
MADHHATVRTLPDGEPVEEAVWRALDLVVDANGDLDVWFAVGAGRLEGRPGALFRFARRAGVEVVGERPVARDLLAVPVDEAVAICQAFCRREPSTVRGHLLDEQRRLDRARAGPGDEAVTRRALAVARAWTEGHGRP